jgi:ATP-dependent RNA helicase HelY
LDCPAAVDVLGRVRVPKHVNHRSPQDRRDLAARIQALDLPAAARGRRGRRPDADAAQDDQIHRLQLALRAHPCHGCPDREQHARWGERFTRLHREDEELQRRIEGRTGSLGRTFDRICALLDERGYLSGDQTTPAGRRLSRIWSEAHLVVAECLGAGAWTGLTGPELAAIVSTLIYEARRREQPALRGLPSPAVRSALEHTTRIWAALAAAEAEHGLPPSREPELGFVWAMYRWARGESLERALAAAAESGADLSAGDFIRWCKQVLDLLTQIVAAPPPSDAPEPVAEAARAALAAIRRGVVAQSMQA